MVAEFLLGLGLFVALLPVVLVLCAAVGYSGRPEKFTPPKRRQNQHWEVISIK